MPAGTLVSVEEYLQTAYHPDCDYVDGDLIDRNVGEFDHSGLQGIIIGILFAQRREKGIYVFPELRVQVAPARFRVPDITVTLRPGTGRILRDPPFLCIEILSPEDRMSRTEEKIADYLRFGTRYVWLIDPDQRKAWSYGRDGKREPGEVLRTADPEITLSLDEIFSALDENVKP